MTVARLIAWSCLAAVAVPFAGPRAGAADRRRSWSCRSTIHPRNRGSPGCARAPRSCSAKCCPAAARSWSIAMSGCRPSIGCSCPAGATLSRASTIKVGQVVTASLVVGGTVAMQGDQIVARARGVRIDTGRLLPEVEASGPITDLYGVFGRLAQQVRGAGAPASPRSPDRLPPTPQVFELYVKGLIAETPATGAGVSRAGAQGRAAVRPRAAGDLGPAFRGVRPSQGARCRHADPRGRAASRATDDSAGRCR